MHYQEILRLTEKIEQALMNGVSESMASLVAERHAAFSRLQEGPTPGNPEDASVIRLIRAAEDRCVQLATAQKKQLAQEMRANNRAKKLHGAYGRHALA